ncbi:MAG: SidA/IucD/PvdA family monooxygenase [Bdellovibrionota bacterium]
MGNNERKTLAVIGAGPKGLAVAIKAKVLEEFGLPVDRVVLIEKHGVAANWSGDFGYTNGEMKLGTSPEKDVVFPLETEVGDDELNERIRQRLLQFTWVSFLVQTRRYSDWVDRGRPSPCHQLWSVYLLWVSEQLEPQASIVKAEVVGIDLTPDGKRWELSLRQSPDDIILSFLRVDRLMLTGPGKTKMDFVEKNTESLPGLYDLESFWAALKTKKISTSGKIAIIGAGENAASALLALSQHAPLLQVDVISPKGFISTRAESYYENQVYSQPERNGWGELDISDRLNFIERTDLGVFSTHAMSILNEQIRHRIIAGRAVGLEQDGQMLSLKIEYGPKVLTRNYDQVILATGFDQISALKSLFSNTALKTLEKAIGSVVNQDQIKFRIQNDLSVKGMQPTLHLPMLAGVMQGPGFANLSCLGSLSDRIVIQGGGMQVETSRSPLSLAKGDI